MLLKLMNCLLIFQNNLNNFYVNCDQVFCLVGEKEPLKLSAKTSKKGFICEKTKISFKEGPTRTCQLLGQVDDEGKKILTADFDFEKWKIGGLSNNFRQIFRRIFIYN